MSDAFALSDDVAALWRPLSGDDEEQVDYLLQIASAQLRQRMRNIDARLALPSTDPMSLDAILVVNVVVGAVRRFLDNPTGASSRSVTTGPYTTTLGYSDRSGNSAPRGVMLITDADVQSLAAPGDMSFGTIRTGSWLDHL